jgi:molybdenum cofactor cytidylyltransferase
MGKIWSIILAAGESKRMGFPKMLLTFNGTTMIEKVIQNVGESNSDGILVVLGASRDRLLDLIGKYDVRHCFNEDYKDGMLSSVQCGFRNLPQDIEAVLVFQGDQPFIGASVINAVIMEYRSSEKGLVIPTYRGRRGHPLLLSGKYFEEVYELDKKEGLRAMTYIHPDDILEVETGDPGIMRDIDTYDEYKKEITQTC